MKIRTPHVFHSQTAEGGIDPSLPSEGQISFYPSPDEVIHVRLPRRAFALLARQMTHSLEQVPASAKRDPSSSATSQNK
jgi:hypothetical protein